MHRLLLSWREQAISTSFQSWWRRPSFPGRWRSIFRLWEPWGCSSQPGRAGCCRHFKPQSTASRVVVSLLTMRLLGESFQWANKGPFVCLRGGHARGWRGSLAARGSSLAPEQQRPVVLIFADSVIPARPADAAGLHQARIPGIQQAPAGDRVAPGSVGKISRTPAGT